MVFLSTRSFEVEWEEEEQSKKSKIRSADFPVCVYLALIAGVPDPHASKYLPNELAVIFIDPWSRSRSPHDNDEGHIFCQ
jgi:hypothetical protein